MAALGYSGGRPPEDVFYRWETFFGGLVQTALVGGLLLWIVAGGPAARLLALRRPTSWWRALGWALVLFVGIVVLGAILEPVLNPGEEQGLVPEDWDRSRAAPFVANVAFTAVLVPIVEESLFRGAGFSLLARYGRVVAIVGTGIAFGLAHGLVLALPLLVAFGVGLAWLRDRTGSVYPAMLVHGVFNAAALILSVAL